MGVKDRRQFSQEFKRNAVIMVLEKGIPVKKAARDLDIHPMISIITVHIQLFRIGSTAP